MPSLGIGHHAGCTIGKSRTHGSRWRRRQMCCRRVCGSTPGDWGSNNPVLAVSLRRCGATAYTSSAVPRFPTMLLSPRPFESRLGGRLGVMDPELRPPLVAIHSVRDTARTPSPCEAIRLPTYAGECDICDAPPRAVRPAPGVPVSLGRHHRIVQGAACESAGPCPRGRYPGAPVCCRCNNQEIGEEHCRPPDNDRARIPTRGSGSPRGPRP